MRSAILRALGFEREDATAARNLLLTGRVACLLTRQRERIGSLADVELSVTSQFGEDGIIDWLIERLEVPAHTFVEFGVEDYREANTRFLLENRNWRGVVLDASERNVARIREAALSWRHDLTAAAAFVTRDNIDSLIAAAGLTGEIGLLSIDLDGNDYWVWERISVVSPIICVCEYNAVFGDTTPIAVPYDAQFQRTRAHHSNLYFGASIAALRSLASRKGYVLAGTSSSGVNAFFVRSDYAARLEGRIASTAPAPSRLRESRDEQGRLTHAGGLARIALIAHLPVVNVETGETQLLKEIDPLYSEAWLRG